MNLQLMERTKRQYATGNTNQKNDFAEPVEFMSYKLKSRVNEKIFYEQVKHRLQLEREAIRSNDVELIVQP